MKIINVREFGPLSFGLSVLDIECCLHFRELLILISFPVSDGVDVRLVGGASDNEGRVEVYYQNTVGTVCDDSWGLEDAEVVCRMLGFPGAEDYKTNAFFGAGAGEIMLDDVDCIGNETNLAECPHRDFFSNNCGHAEDAGVVCLTGRYLPFLEHVYFGTLVLLYQNPKSLLHWANCLEFNIPQDKVIYIYV